MITSIIFIMIGLVLLVYSADYLVKGASTLAASVGVSPLVVGLTVVAFGTSAPELAVSVMSAYKGQSDIALGNVVGSNTFNVLFILGVSALIIPLVVHAQLVRFDVPVMIFVSFLLFGLGYDGNLSKVDGIILTVLLAVYVYFLLKFSKQEKDAAVLSEFDAEYGNPPKDPQWIKNLAFVIGGVIGLIAGSKLLVDGAVDIAKSFGVSELVIGLTIISAGTSLPEVATSVMAAIKGERDIAVGNVVGSNIFNIITVLGLSSIIAPSGISVAKEAIAFDIPFMIAVAIACFPIFFHNYKIGRISGLIFLSYYVIYVIYLILKAQGSPSFASYHQIFFSYAVPFAALFTLGALIKGIVNLSTSKKLKAS